MRAQPAPAALRDVVGVTRPCDRNPPRGNACTREPAAHRGTCRGRCHEQRDEPDRARGGHGGGAQRHTEREEPQARASRAGPSSLGVCSSSDPGPAPYAVRSPRRRSPRATATRGSASGRDRPQVDPESQVRAFVALTWPESIAGPGPRTARTSTASTGSGGRPGWAVRSRPRRRLRLRRWCGAARRSPRPAQLCARPNAVDQLLNLEVALRSYLGCMSCIGR